VLLHLTRKERDDKYDSNQLRTEPWRPNQDDRRASRMLWSMMSKAAERSRRHRHDNNCCDPIACTVIYTAVYCTPLQGIFIMVLCFVYGCNLKSLRESCKFYRFRRRAVYKPCSLPCTRPCTTAVYNGRVHGPVGLIRCLRVRVVNTPCIHDLRVETVYTAVYTERVHGRVHDNVRGRISRVHGRGHVDGHGPCNGVQYTAVYIRPYMCTWPVHGRVTYGP